MKKILSLILITVFTATICFAPPRTGSGSRGSHSSGESYSSKSNEGYTSGRESSSGYETYSRVHEEFVRKSNGSIPFEQTNNISESKVYIDILGEEIIAVSNYSEASNKPSDNSREGEKLDIKLLADNAGGTWNEYFEQEVIINQKVFSKYSVENIEKILNAKVLTPEGEVYPVKEFETGEAGQKIVGAEIYPNCYINVKKKFGNFVHFLKTKKIEPDEVIVSSLVTNTETNNALKEQLPDNHSIFSCKNESEFRQEISKHKHKTIFLVGHIENGKFVNKNPNGEIVFEVEVERLLEISKDLDVNILPFGCYSGQYSPSGMTSEINSLKTVDILSNSLKTVFRKNNNMGELLNEIGTNSESKLLIDEQNFKNQKYGNYKKIQILKKEGSKWVIVAILYMIDFPEDDEEYEDDTTWYWIKQKSPYFTLGSLIAWYLIPGRPGNKMINLTAYIASAGFWLFFVVLVLSLI